MPNTLNNTVDICLNLYKTWPVAERWPGYHLLAVTVDAQLAAPQSVRPAVLESDDECNYDSHGDSDDDYLDCDVVQEAGARVEAECDEASVGEVGDVELIRGVIVPSIW